MTLIRNGSGGLFPSRCLPVNSGRAADVRRLDVGEGPDVNESRDGGLNAAWL